MISQLKIFAMLQWLDLAPAWPLLPNPRFLIPFTSTSPIQIPLLPAQWTPRTFVAYVISLGSSPLLLCAAHRHIDNVLVSKLLEYAQIAFPRPENPDMCSIKAARDADLDDATVPGLGFSIEHGVFKSRPRLTLFGVIKKDFQAAIRRLLATGEDMRQRVNGMLTKPLADEGGTRVSLIRSNEAEEETLQEQSITPLGLSPAAEGPTDTTEISFSADVNPSRVPVEGSSTATPSPQLSATEDEDIVTSEPGNTFVQIRTRAGSTDTLHMNVEINGAIPGAPTYTSSFSASPRPTIIQSTMTQAVDGMAASFPPLPCLGWADLNFFRTAPQSHRSHSSCCRGSWPASSISSHRLDSNPARISITTLHSSSIPERANHLACIAGCQLTFEGDYLPHKQLVWPRSARRVEKRR